MTETEEMIIQTMHQIKNKQIWISNMETMFDRLARIFLITGDEIHLLENFPDMF